MSTTVLDRPAAKPEAPAEPCVPQGEPAYAKPSALLRLGASFRRQARTRIYDRRTDGTCALGALYEGAMGYPFLHTLPDNDACGRFALRVCERTGYEVRTAKVRLRRANGLKRLPREQEEVSLHNALIYLNDTLGWTREQIAAYLEEQGL